MAALDAGYDVKASGVTLDRFCGSGITAVNLAAASIMSGMEDLVIAGGTEMMSLHHGRPPIRKSAAPSMDNGNLRLRASHPQSHQGVCADAIATLEGISRQAVDELALVSQQRADAAIKGGHFDRALVAGLQGGRHAGARPRGVPAAADHAGGPAALKPSFEAMADVPIDDKGTTFGGLILQKLSRPEDHPRPPCRQFVRRGRRRRRGAARLADYAKAHGLKPRARVVAMANMGDCPTLMLNAPVPAARKVLAKAGLTLDDIDLFEINEAFAVVAEKFIRDLKLDRDKVNVNGGAMALGHPIGATGAILIGTILDELERRDLKRGLVTMCAAGGMAPAIIIERV